MRIMYYQFQFNSHLFQISKVKLKVTAGRETPSESRLLVEQGTP